VQDSPQTTAPPPINANGIDSETWETRHVPGPIAKDDGGPRWADRFIEDERYVPVGAAGRGHDVSALLAMLLDLTGRTGSKVHCQCEPASRVRSLALTVLAVSADRVAAELVEIRRLLGEDRP
jgi:hypothetical protein